MTPDWIPTIAAVPFIGIYLAVVYLSNRTHRRLHDPAFDELRWAAERVDYAGTSGRGRDLEALVAAIGEARGRGATITDIGRVIGATDRDAIDRLLRRYASRTTEPADPMKIGGNR